MAQLRRVGAAGDARVAFFPARRPADSGPFPSLGARGCFESHLAVIRQAIEDGIERLLIVEDDFDFVRDINCRGPEVMSALATEPWDIFYGASIIDVENEPSLHSDVHGLCILGPNIAVETASFVGIARPALLLLEPFLLAILGRPAGSPDYGPMHVDGAYSIFRQEHPSIRTLACKPSIGGQRASRSDIATNTFLLDRFVLTRPLANQLRRSLAWIRS